MTLSPHHVITALSNDRDELSANCVDLAARLAAAVDLLEIERRKSKQYEAEFIRLREEHATAVFAAQESARALRDLTVRTLGQELNKAVVK